MIGTVVEIGISKTQHQHTAVAPVYRCSPVVRSILGSWACNWLKRDHSENGAGMRVETKPGNKFEFTMIWDYMSIFYELYELYMILYVWFRKELTNHRESRTGVLNMPPLLNIWSKIRGCLGPDKSAGSHVSFPSKNCGFSCGFSDFPIRFWQPQPMQSFRIHWGIWHVFMFKRWLALAKNNTVPK